MFGFENTYKLKVPHKRHMYSDPRKVTDFLNGTEVRAKSPLQYVEIIYLF